MIHRDVSVNNVLLDAEYETRLSDFGTARFLGPGRSDCTNLVGTYGYMAPGTLLVVYYTRHQVPKLTRLLLAQSWFTSG